MMVALGTIKPPPELTISEWADRERFLSAESSAEPGRWRTSRAPYLRGIMDAIFDPATPIIVAMKGTQIGWTEVLNNTCGYHIDQDPCPILIIQPTLELADTWSKDRLAPMLRDTPALARKVSDPRTRDSGNTIRQKEFRGGRLTIVGANAAAGLASRPIRIVLADEVDKYPPSAGTEGSPLRLATKRQQNFWNRKTLIGSSPGRKVLSVVYPEFEKSDKRRYHVPCPHCDHPQVLRWAQVSWDKLPETPPKAEYGRHLPDTAHYICEECGAAWDDIERWRAIAEADRRAVAGDKAVGWIAERKFAGVAGFHVPGFLSTWLTLAEIVREFLKAKDDPFELQVWVNTVLGEPWEEASESVDGSALINRAENYAPDSIPDAVRLITAGVDTQGDRLEVQVMGFGVGEESWVLDYIVVYGDPATVDVWNDLDHVLQRRYLTDAVAPRALRIAAACVDSGGLHTAQVHAYCRRRRARRIFATKGAPGPRPVWPKYASRAGPKGADQVFVIGVDSGKESLYGRLRVTKPGPRYVHFPVGEAFDARYYDQLTSEQVVTRKKDGYTYRVWILPEHKRNEALDTAVLCLAARASIPVRLERMPATLPAPPPQPSELEEPTTPVTPSGEPQPQSQARPTYHSAAAPRPWMERRSGWLHR